MDRLKAVVRHDQTGRAITEFVDSAPHLPRPMSTWMDQFKTPVFEQIRIAKNPTDNAKFLAHWQALRAKGQI
jgi:hypothetical protein